MSKVLVTESYLDDIADAIREKLGGSDTYKPGEMAAAIESIDSGYPEPTGTLPITANGTVNVKDYASANVNVPNSYSASDEGKVVDNGALVPQTSRNIITNDTYDTTTNNEVTVNVQPNLQSKTATQNGTVTADSGYDGLSSVVVNVPNSYAAEDEGKVVSSGALVAQTSRTVTENGTYDTTENNEVVVNVSGSTGQPAVPDIALSPYGAPLYKLINGRDITGFHNLYGFFAPINNAGWMDFDWTESWEIGVAFKLDNLSGNFAVIGEGNSPSRYADIPGLEIVSDTLGRGISTTGNTTWSDWATVKTGLLINTWYFTVMAYDKATMILTNKITTDFENWDTITYTMTAAPYHNAQYKICFGGLMRNSAHTKADAHIDILNTYIKINGDIAWGVYTGTFPQS